MADDVNALVRITNKWKECLQVQARPAQRPRAQRPGGDAEAYYLDASTEPLPLPGLHCHKGCELWEKHSSRERRCASLAGSATATAARRRGPFRDGPIRTTQPL